MIPEMGFGMNVEAQLYCRCLAAFTLNWKITKLKAEFMLTLISLIEKQ